MVEIDDDFNVLRTIDKSAVTDLTLMRASACLSPAFTQLLDTYLQENLAREKEIILGDVFDAALARGMKVKGLPFLEGQNIDIGTAVELDSALKKFHL